MVGMTSALSGAPGLAVAELGEYRVGYISQDGMRHQVSLADAQAVRFEVMSPARRFAARKGQRHLPGLWWSSTVAGHVGYESWLERDRLICSAAQMRPRPTSNAPPRTPVAARIPALPS